MKSGLSLLLCEKLRLELNCYSRELIDPLSDFHIDLSQLRLLGSCRVNTPCLKRGSVNFDLFCHQHFGKKEKAPDFSGAFLSHPRSPKRLNSLRGRAALPEHPSSSPAYRRSSPQW